jgi:hypothetical protein
MTAFLVYDSIDDFYCSEVHFIVPLSIRCARAFQMNNCRQALSLPALLLSQRPVCHVEYRLRTSLSADFGGAG